MEMKVVEKKFNVAINLISIVFLASGMAIAMYFGFF